MLTNVNLTNEVFPKYCSNCYCLSLLVMMSQQSGDPFAALIRVNTVVQAVVGNGNVDIRLETTAEYQGWQEGQKAGRYQSKMRETVQNQITMIK